MGICRVEYNRELEKQWRAEEDRRAEEAKKLREKIQREAAMNNKSQIHEPRSLEKQRNHVNLN